MRVHVCFAIILYRAIVVNTPKTKVGCTPFYLVLLKCHSRYYLPLPGTVDTMVSPPRTVMFDELLVPARLVLSKINPPLARNTETHALRQRYHNMTKHCIAD